MQKNTLKQNRCNVKITFQFKIKIMQAFFYESSSRHFHKIY